MPSHHPFNVRIINTATGQPLEEHRVSTAGNRVECYIESTVGTEFHIKVELANNFRDVHPTFRVEPTVDGTKMGNKLMGVLDLRVKKYTKLDGIHLGNQQWRRMKFANTTFAGTLLQRNQPLTLGVEDGGRDNAKLAKLGQIEVRIIRVTDIVRKSENNENRKDVDTGSLIVNEKAKKALITHAVEFV
jgi:hypothetical protein